MRIAYADPPYVGCARLYPEHPESEVYNSVSGHRDLIDRLVEEFPDGWGLSCSSTSLRDLLPYCPERARVLAWVKPFCTWRGSVNPAYTWEPLIIVGGRSRSHENPKVRDYLSASAPLLKGLPGAKPREFCMWFFACMGCVSGDELVDLFPGTGIVSDSWYSYTRQLSLEWLEKR
jgi:hypothetical protein